MHTHAQSKWIWFWSGSYSELNLIQGFHHNFYHNFYHKFDHNCALGVQGKLSGGYLTLSQSWQCKPKLEERFSWSDGQGGQQQGKGSTWGLQVISIRSPLSKHLYRYIYITRMLYLYIYIHTRTHTHARTHARKQNKTKQNKSNQIKNQIKSNQNKSKQSKSNQLKAKGKLKDKHVPASLAEASHGRA